MAKLIYASNMSLDGWTEDERGAFDWAPPDDDVFVFITKLMRSRGHLPLRPAHVRDAGSVGDGPHPGRAVGPNGRLRQRLAGGGQGCLLVEPGRADHREDSGSNATSTSALVHDLKAAAVGRPLGRWPESRSAGARRRAGRRTRTCSSGQSSSVGATPRCRPTCAPISRSSTSTDSAAVSSTFATAFSNGAGIDTAHCP